ncbi:MAG: low temperature requirement protein A [Firmicutes bacterium]|nr:low temperature requirement protein A [Bacillota bacterium]
MTDNQSEKKVEYLELIYDLIFVYIIGRNNSLLHYLDGGFVSGPMFLAYVLCTLAVIQIWNFSTFYINVYGRNSIRDHVFLCINMFLIYFMADGTNPQWQETFYKYTIAWTLILVNLSVQHLIETRNHEEDPWVIPQLKQKAAIIFAEAGLVVIHIIVYTMTGVSIAYVPIIFGIAAMLISSRMGTLVPVDFAHLAERAMLYVVFTFGEMIIAISGYFSGELTTSTIYFAAMAFLIVVGLFLSYGTIYNKLLDKEMLTDGVEYMAIHIFLIFALNDLSGALEFMREDEVALLPKTLFLTCSFVIYFFFLFLTGKYAKQHCRHMRRFVLAVSGVGVSFVALMLLLRENMYVNIALTVLYVFGIFSMIYRQGKNAESAGGDIIG